MVSSESTQRCQLLRPRAVSQGAQVGIFAPSLPLASILRERFDFAVQQLAESLNVVPVLAANVTARVTGFTAGSAAARAAQFDAFIADDKIEAIFCSIGGFNSAEMLPLIDWEQAKRTPKVLVGYSDCTSLLLGLQARADWITFHGPAVMTQFGEYPAIFPYTVESLTRAVRGGLTGIFPQPNFWTNERLEWGDGSWRTRARHPSGLGSAEVWREGRGDGVVWGGNLETVNMLAGTPYFAPPAGPIVLFFEVVEAEAFLPRVRRALVQLAQCGVLERTRAMLVGRSPDAADFMGESLRSTVSSFVQAWDFPVIADLPLGHTDPLATLPIGCRMSVDASGSHLALCFQEEAVLVP